MRLTVRTLLAWMDEVLGPEDQQALSAKVEASPVAAQLADRARALVGRSGLAAPQPDGRGLADDPNTAAEFLDNVLGGDRLEAFERVCVESDMHLAEAAACHRLLAEWSRDPQTAAAPDAAARRRLLEAVAKHVATAEPREAAVVPGVEVAAAPASVTRQADGRRPPIAAWVSAVMALGLLVVLGGVLAWSLVRGARVPRQVAGATVTEANVSNRAAAGPARPSSEVEAKVEGVAQPPAAVTEPPADAEAPPPPPVAEAPADGAAAVPQPPQEAAAPESDATAAPAMAEPPRPAAERRVPHGDALAIVAPPPAAAGDPTPPRPDAPVGPVEPPVDAGPPTATVGSGGPLLHRFGAAAGPARWAPLVTGASLAADEDLLVPPWCHPVLTVEGVSIRLEPNTRVVLGRDADGTPRLEVLFGRAVVGGEAADAKLGITAGGLVGVLSGELRQPAGVDVTLQRAIGDDPAGGTVRRRVRLHMGSAQKVWRQTAVDGGPAAPPLAGIAVEGVVAARAVITWDDADPAAAVVDPPSVEPAWMRGGGSGDRTERGAARALADRLAPDGDVVKELHAMAGDRRAENRLIAAATLALLGDYDDLVTLLCAESVNQRLSESQWTTLESLTVPLALARGANAAAAFAAAVEARAPAGKAAEILALARGFSDADLAAGGDAALVDALADDSLVIRRYALKRLIEIAEPQGRHRTAYRADHPPGLRKEAIEWWRARLQQGLGRGGGAGAGPPAAAP